MDTARKILQKQRIKFKSLQKSLSTFRSYSTLGLLLSFFLFVWIILLYPTCFRSSSYSTPLNRLKLINQTLMAKTAESVCRFGHSFSLYIYQLPSEFNLGLLSNCAHLNSKTNMCPHVANNGLGQPVNHYITSTTNSWFATHQSVAEMIFHARLENHPCRTRDPSRAKLFFVPFYGGLYASSKFREANHTSRDQLAIRLVDYLQSQPWWDRHQGEDHFLALGRIAWDFMRLTRPGAPDYGANTLLNLPAVHNMSVLTIERDPLQGSNQRGIPYPSYFHPRTWHEMLTWQDTAKRSKRPYLFSFIGAPRKSVKKAAIRNEFIRQCNVSTRCELLLCARGRQPSKCNDPKEVLGVMTRSRFCLQAPGDSYTRRSTFDSVLAGCIPVFFSPHTAYTQYGWYLPEDGSSYSVYMEEKIARGNKRIEKELMKISREREEKMRSTVINLIPKLTYAHPNASDAGFMDAVDVALESLVHHLNSIRTPHLL